MPRKLLSQVEPVKQRGGALPWVSLVSIIGAFLHACGSAPPKQAVTDPFGERVANCITAARPVSDAAQGAMIGIPAGPATVGSSESDRARARLEYGPGSEALFRNERPVGRAQLAAFRIDRTPVTNDQFAEFVRSCGAIPPDHEGLPQSRWEQLQESQGSRFGYATVQRFLWSSASPPPNREKHPSVLIDQEQAAFFCAWRGARLPTEEEWERASRGPGASRYPWGPDYDPSRVNSQPEGGGDTERVGSRPAGASPEGVLELGGHVFEWTSSASGEAAGAFVVKGKGWTTPGGFGRGAARLTRAASVREVDLGFRCAADEAR